MITRLHIAAVLLVSLLTFVGCDHNIIDIPLPGGSNAGSYSWNPKNRPQLDYTVEAANTTKTLSLRFSQNDSLAYTINEQFGSLSDTLYISSDAKNISLTGLGHQSVIAIPEPYEFSQVDTQLVEKLPAMKHILAVGDIVIACDDSSTIYRLPAGSNTWQLASSFAKVNKETILSIINCKYKANGQTDIVAGTNKGRLILSTDNGSNWTTSGIQQFTNPVRALCTNPDGTLFAAVENEGVYKISSGVVAKAIPFPSKVVPSSLAYFLSFDSLSASLALGTYGNGLWRYNLKSNNSSWEQYSLSIRPLDSIRFVCSDKETNLIAATTENLWYISDSIIAYDTAAHIASGSFVSAVYNNTTSTFAIAANHEAVFKLGLHSHSLSSEQPLFQRQLYAIATTKQSIGVATDSGIYNLSASAWINQSQGIATTKTKFPVVTYKSFLMLKQNSDNENLSSTWEVGTLRSKGISYTITATVEDHFDSIALNNKIVFSNLYSVHYTLSNPLSADPLTLPDWKIYFAKDQGPVLIDQHQNGALLRRTYRSSK